MRGSWYLGKSKADWLDPISEANLIAVILICVGIVALVVYTLFHYPAASCPPNLGDFFQETVKRGDKVYLCILYLGYVLLGGLPMGLCPLGFWLVNLAWRRVLGFLALFIAVRYLWRRTACGETPMKLYILIHIGAGFVQTVSLLKSLPNKYELGMYLVASFAAPFSVDFLMMMLTFFQVEILVRNIRNFGK